MIPTMEPEPNDPLTDEELLRALNAGWISVGDRLDPLVTRLFLHYFKDLPDLLPLPPED